VYHCLLVTIIYNAIKYKYNTNTIQAKVVLCIAPAVTNDIGPESHLMAKLVYKL